MLTNWFTINFGALENNLCVLFLTVRYIVKSDNYISMKTEIQVDVFSYLLVLRFNYPKDR